MQIKTEQLRCTTSNNELYKISAAPCVCRDKTHTCGSSRQLDWSVTRYAGYHDGFCDRGARFVGALRPQKQYGLLGTGAGGGGGGEGMRPGPPPCSHSSEF